MDVSLISDLSLILASKKSVTVQPVTGQQGAYELRYRLDPKHDPDGLEHRVLVDAGKGWLVTRHEQFFPDGKSARLSTCDYKRGDDGRWIPSKGQFRNLWGKDVPGLDWRFAVRRIAVNDPKFDDGVFAVKAERGVYVSDIRQLVSYWAEENIASASDLARLTRDAVARRRDGFRAPGGPNLAGPTLGRPAPDFTVKTLDGGTFRLQEQRGKCVLLYFWAAKAPPDKTELSILKYIQRKLAGHREFAMLGLCIGAPADIRRVAKEKDITWPQARTDTPSQDHVPQDYNTQGFGWVILIGPDGNVLLKRRSGAVAMNPALSELLE
jgi:cytochrome oxidase Cu insertion factor (SCO1/SenC/PrrC family)